MHQELYSTWSQRLAEEVDASLRSLHLVKERVKLRKRQLWNKSLISVKKLRTLNNHHHSFCIQFFARYLWWRNL